ncbi:hypothetical protein D3C73_849130 [compost metagenome]
MGRHPALAILYSFQITVMLDMDIFHDVNSILIIAIVFTVNRIPHILRGDGEILQVGSSLQP